MIKRLFDFIFSFLGIVVLLPIYLIVGILIIIDDPGSIFYNQIRVGRKNKDFSLFKFRTMKNNADKSSLLTVGARDARVTRIGYYLRRYKIDELPQLFNVLIGDMSFVGPRPEVRKYVEMYNKEQLKVLEVKPGITDVASLEYINENEILGKSKNPEKTYIDTIMPAKLRLNLEYISRRSLMADMGVILRTIVHIFR